MEAEIAEERDKCQRMMDEKRREIEAWATEVCLSGYMYCKAHCSLCFVFLIRGSSAR